MMSILTDDMQRQINELKESVKVLSAQMQVVLDTLERMEEEQRMARTRAMLAMEE